MSKMISKKLQVVTENQLLEEVARDLKIDPRDVRRTYDIWIQFLDYIANETDQATIQIPRLGRMYVSVHKLKRGLYTQRLKKFKEGKLKTIEKVRENSQYNIHEHNVPIILKYGISKKNSIPFILGKSEKTTFYTINEIVNNQTRIFFKEDLEFSDNEKLEKIFYRNLEENEDI